MQTKERKDRDGVLILDQYISMQREAINCSPNPCKSLASIVDAIETCRNDGRMHFAFILMTTVLFDAKATDAEKERLCEVVTSNKEVREILAGLALVATNPAAPSRN